MNSSILEELEHLRQSLENPQASSNLVAADVQGLVNDYNKSLNSAESTAERLSQALEATKGGFRGVAESLRVEDTSLQHNKDVEIQELRRMLQAKESSLDSLRETLAATKTSAESKSKRLAEQLEQAHNEIRAMKIELDKVQSEKDEIEAKLKTALSTGKRHEKEYSSRENELWEALQKAHNEHEITLQELDHEKSSHEKIKKTIQEMQQTIEEGKTNEGEIKRLKNQLIEEKERFKKARKWLKAEMKSREEMEELLISFKDMMATATTNYDSLDDFDSSVLDEDSDLSNAHSQFKIRQERLNTEGKSLRSQLHSTKKKLSKALKYKDTRLAHDVT